MDVIDVIGRPLHDAEEMLERAGIKWRVERTRPTRDFFPLDENRLYVVRQAAEPDGFCVIVAAAALRREV